jgi:hypothetical protein
MPIGDGQPSREQQRRGKASTASTRETAASSATGLGDWMMLPIDGPRVVRVSPGARRFGLSDEEDEEEPVRYTTDKHALGDDDEGHAKRGRVQEEMQGVRVHGCSDPNLYDDARLLHILKQGQEEMEGSLQDVGEEGGREQHATTAFGSGGDEEESVYIDPQMDRTCGEWMAQPVDLLVRDYPLHVRVLSWSRARVSHICCSALISLCTEVTAR